MKRCCTLFWIVVFCSFGLCDEQTVFKDIKIHRHHSAQKRVLVDKSGTLVFDDSTHKLSFTDDAQDHFEASYDDVVKAVFDSTARMRGGVLAGAVPIAGIAIQAAHVNKYWLYLAYKDQGRDEDVLLEAPGDHSDEVIAKARAAFGARVTVSDFPEKGAEIKPADLPALKSKHSLKVSKEIHPMPEIKPDKATILVVCPPLAARYAGMGNQYKLHANDKVVVVNVQGTYGYAYLDPGTYRLASQSENANGFEMNLEAGHEYYFVQETFMGMWKGQTALSRNSPELVTYLVDGAYYADWKPKD